MSIRIVTDSTSDISQELASKLRIVVVPAIVNIGEKSYRDGIDLTREEFYRALPEMSEMPTTAPPGPATFTDVYRQLLAEGATAILSIHLASKLSGMLNTARLGAEALDNEVVTLYDSQQATMGLGLLVLMAAEAAEAGRSLTEIIETLDASVNHTYVIAVLDTLEYLRRSGRLSWAQFGVGTLLNIKPLIKVHLGEVLVVERVRTSKRALSRLIELVEELGPLKKVALLNIGDQEKVETLRQMTAHILPESSEPLIAEATPVIGTHVGPGALGIACVAAGKN